MGELEINIPNKIDYKLTIKMKKWFYSREAAIFYKFFFWPSHQDGGERPLSSRGGGVNALMARLFCGFLNSMNQKIK